MRDSGSDRGIKHTVREALEGGEVGRTIKKQNRNPQHLTKLWHVSKHGLVNSAWDCMYYRVVQAKIWTRTQLDTTVAVHKTKQTESIMAFGQGKPIWKQMQELKWIISLWGSGNTNRFCTAYRKSTVWLKASSTSLASPWYRKRPETTLNDEL